jgi:hypothetical protein
MQADGVEWPWPVIGTLPGRDSCVSWRNDGHKGVLGWWRDGACRQQLCLTHQLSRVVWDEAGNLLCSSYLGKLLRVSSATREHHVIGTDLPGIVGSDAAGIFVAEARLGPDGQPDRWGTSVSWRLDDGRWTPIADAALGAPWSIAQQDEWTAAAHPRADCVTLSRGGTPIAWLAVHFPVCLAWAGRSLVVAVANGDVLLFPDVTGALISRLAKRS